jgi:hypothetical protein
MMKGQSKSDNTAPRFPIYLGALQIEKEFLLAIVHLKRVVVLDGIERTTDPLGFRIRSHDLYGDLPEIFISDNGDRTLILEEISLEGAKTCAIAKHRANLASLYPGCRFLPHTILEAKVRVGIQVGVKTLLAESTSFWEAYLDLKETALRSLN